MSILIVLLLGSLFAPAMLADVYSLAATIYSWAPATPSLVDQSSMELTIEQTAQMFVSTSFLSLITPRTRLLAASTLVVSMARPRPISLDPMVLWFSPIATSFTFVMGMAAALRSSHSL